jgi:hypothetical protein
MTIVTANAGTVADRFDTAFAAVIGFCAEFCADARQGRDTEGGYAEPGHKSDLNPAAPGTPSSAHH